MFKAFVWSIPGTGTQFTRQLLRVVYGYEDAARAPNPNESPRGEVAFNAHVCQSSEDLALPLKVVIPLRHPILSFLTRYRHQGGWDRAHDHFTVMWTNFFFKYRLLDHVFLPVDTDLDRAWLIDRVGKHLEAQVVSQAQRTKTIDFWPKIGSDPHRNQYKAEFLESGTVEGRRLGFLGDAVEWYHQQIHELENEYHRSLCDVRPESAVQRMPVAELPEKGGS